MGCEKDSTYPGLSGTDVPRITRSTTTRSNHKVTQRSNIHSRTSAPTSAHLSRTARWQVSPVKLATDKDTISPHAMFNRIQPRLLRMRNWLAPDISFYSKNKIREILLQSSRLSTRKIGSKKWITPRKLIFLTVTSTGKVIFSGFQFNLSKEWNDRHYYSPLDEIHSFFVLFLVFHL